jgi:hypothetical protein
MQAMQVAKAAVAHGWLRFAGAACAACLFATGCGGQSDADRIQQTVKTYLSALADGDGAKACDQLTGDQTRAVVDHAITSLPELQASGCADALTKLSGSLGADEKQTLRDAKVTQVQVSGDSATAEVVGGSKTAELQKSHGRSLISGGLAF